jgi:hypothetical protein
MSASVRHEDVCPCAGVMMRRLMCMLKYALQYQLDEAVDAQPMSEADAAMCGLHVQHPNMTFEKPDIAKGSFDTKDNWPILWQLVADFNHMFDNDKPFVASAKDWDAYKDKKPYLVGRLINTYPDHINDAINTLTGNISKPDKDTGKTSEDDPNDADDKPDDVKPDDVKPDDVKPDDAKPDDAKPDDAKIDKPSNNATSDKSDGASADKSNEDNPDDAIQTPIVDLPNIVTLTGKHALIGRLHVLTNIIIDIQEEINMSNGDSVRCTKTDVVGIGGRYDAKLSETSQNLTDIIYFTHYAFLSVLYKNTPFTKKTWADMLEDKAFVDEFKKWMKDVESLRTVENGGLDTDAGEAGEEQDDEKEENDDDDDGDDWEEKNEEIMDAADDDEGDDEDEGEGEDEDDDDDDDDDSPLFGSKKKQKTDA